MSSFTPRTTAPEATNNMYYADNPFYQAGYGMPNCTCYAWGRFWEITGERPNLSTGDAEKWYNKTDGYQRGQVPRLGAVACWRRGDPETDADGAGHVAIVEYINGDNITTSNSAYNSSNFYLQELTKESGYTWNESYIFQGFIYPPLEIPTRWIYGNRYLTQTEMENNALIIYDRLFSAGWSLNAIAGILGNMEHESTINPQIWQSLDYGNTSGGFGLVQWTPATKYIEWAGDLYEIKHEKQIERILWELENNQQYIATTNYPESFKEYSTSGKSPYYLGCAFVYNYERSYVALYGTEAERRDMEEKRGSAAERWYKFLCGAEPGEPVRPKWDSVPIWFLFKLGGI